jgi:pimeloyl-ACP methyl ester carboxylesterase
VLTGCFAGDQPQADGDGTSSPPPSPSGSRTAGGSDRSARSDLDRFYDQEPDWRDCRQRFECATVEVPLDYADPGGEVIELAVNRLPASEQDDRIGSLLLNPGGPGSSGLDYARSADRVVSADLRRRFDVVGFDPRGVGESSPIDCLTDEQTDTLVAADGSPDSPAEVTRLADLSRQLGQRCAQRSPDLVEHVGTRDAARDLDVLRAVLGDERLSYLGKSYGTYLGATYAGLFPDRVGVMVLDGALDPSTTSTEIAQEQAVGFEQALAAFVSDCLGLADCPLSGDLERGLTQVDRLLARIDREPLTGQDGRPVTEGLAVLGLAAALYDEGSGWPVLRLALTQARRGDGQTLLALADFYLDRRPDGTYATNSNEAIYAVNCLDRPAGGGVEEAQDDADLFARAAPRFGRYLAWSGLPCATWPAPPQGDPERIEAAGAAPILVVGTTRDPATPYQWAESLARQLESGRLLTFDGDGHTAYRRGSDCIDAAVDRYLLGGGLPAEGTTCR